MLVLNFTSVSMPQVADRSRFKTNGDQACQTSMSALSFSPI
jgi:hypothetical protein